MTQWPNRSDKHAEHKRRNQLARIVAIAAFASMITGCQMNQQRNHSYVTAPTDIGATAAHHADAILLDVRSRADYEAGHVRGARWLDLGEWMKLAKSGNDGLDHFKQWQSRISAVGIGSEDTVRVYDDGAMTEAARVWFILQHFDVERAVVVNGGFRAMKAALPADEIESGPPKPVTTSTQSWPNRTGGKVELRSREDVRRCMTAKEAKILDSRTPAEYRGDDLRTNKRGGHIPGAVNLSHTELLNADGQLKSAAELRALFEKAGLKPGDHIIAHCQSGGRSSLAALALVEAGYSNVANYYLSFSDWAADESCPLEKGK